MTKHPRLILTLVSLGLCAGLAALATTPVAHATELLRGKYLVSNSIDGPAGLWVRTVVQDGEQTRTRNLRCVLPAGADSLQAYCPSLELALPVEVVAEDTYLTTISVDFLALDVGATNAGLDLLDADPIKPQIERAEAEWGGWFTGWVCVIEPADILKCTDTCGGPGDVSATPYPSNNWNPASEPQCEVTCDCQNSDVETTWKDPQQILPAP